jgi:hypothetical protein
VSHDPNKETSAERLARKKEERAAYLRKQEAEAFERENQPRDAEELRNANAEDAHLAENLNAILRGFEGMDSRQFEAALRKTSSRKIKKAGGKSAVRKAYRKKKGCGKTAAVLLLALGSAVGGLTWGAVELAGAVLG